MHFLKRQTCPRSKSWCNRQVYWSMLTSKLDIRVYNDRIATKNYVAIPEQRKITCFSGNVCLTHTRMVYTFQRCCLVQEKSIRQTLIHGLFGKTWNNQQSTTWHATSTRVDRRCIVTLGTQVCGCGHMYMAFLLRLFQQYNYCTQSITHIFVFF